MKERIISTYKIGILFLLMACSGCIGMIADAYVSNYPSYQDVILEVPHLQEGFSRVFIYFPKGIKNFCWSR